MNATRVVRRAVPESWPALVSAGETPALARLLAARGVRTAAELNVDLAALPGWESLANIEPVVARLAAAIAEREPILVVADYDADGATACAVAVRGLRAFGAQVDFLVPNRFEYGYGLTPEIVAVAAERAPRILLTVDNGIGSVEGVRAARERGLDVVITDHHLAGDELPPSPYIVNPNQPGCPFPAKNLAGVGVLFYVLIALRARLRREGRLPADGKPVLAELLDLVALGTIADVVRLDHVNRILVSQGLSRMRAGRSQVGVRALFAAAGRDSVNATTYDLGFVLGPRLNAAGRLADMSLGISCLTTDDPALASQIAQELDRLNRERRVIEAQMRDEALADCTVEAGDRASVSLFRPDWHQGVVGLVAARVRENTHRPAFAFARGSDGTLRGSGRSIPGLHLRDALDQVAKRHPTLILRFGGHAAAAGLTLHEIDFDRFREAFEAVARTLLSPADLQREIESDGDLPVSETTIEFAQDLRFRTWGQGFPAPAFDAPFRVLDQKIVGGAHRKLSVMRDGHRFEAIIFRQPDPLPAEIQAVFRPEANEFRGIVSLQLVIEHWS